MGAHIVYISCVEFQIFGWYTAEYFNILSEIGV
jgi:hypothetical protein